MCIKSSCRSAFEDYPIDQPLNSRRPRFSVGARAAARRCAEKLSPLRFRRYNEGDDEDGWGTGLATMIIQVKEENGVTVYRLEGRIDHDGATQLDAALREKLGAEKPQIVVDMSQVPYINSAALRVLADITSQCRARGGDLKLAALSPQVRRVLQIVGFDQFTAVYETVAEAVRSFSEASGA